jgi:hypothetical protein
LPNATITNLTSQRVFINDLYVDLPPGGSVSTYRTSSDLMKATRLQELVADGIVSLTLAYTADEQATSFTIFPGIGGLGMQNVVQFGKGITNDTIAKALAAAAAMSPSALNPVAIVCLDAGIYAEDFTIPEYVTLYAPAITVQGHIIFGGPGPTTCLINKLEVATGTGVDKLNGTGGVSRFEANELVATGAANGVLNSDQTAGSVLIYEVKSTYVENGIAIGDGSVNVGHMHLMCEDVYITGTGFGVARFGIGTTEGYIAHILETGGGIGNGTAIVGAGGTIDLFVHRINANTAVNVSGAGADVNLFVASLIGATVGAGTLRIAQPV